MAKQNELKNLRSGDSYLNLIVGIIVVVAVAAVIIGLIRGRNQSQTAQNQQEQQSAKTEQQLNLPAKHTVAEGEDLWKISEKYYKTGYNWTDIAEVNDLKNNPNALNVGTELTIPNVTPKMVGEVTPIITVAPTATPVAQQITPSDDQKGNTAQSVGEPISGSSYTVANGDYLWEIALRAYGDGYKWVDIAKANKLVNPDVIHTGNVLTLPR